MSEALEMAGRIFEAENGRKDDCPYGRRPHLSDLWEADQVRYVKLAEIALASASTSTRSRSG